MDKDILVVESDRWTRHLLYVMFRDLGSVTLVRSRTDALQAIAEVDFDVVVTDFDLAELSYDWIDELVSRRLPTVVITARCSAEELERINGTARVFGRPFNPNTIREEVEALLAE